MLGDEEYPMTDKILSPIPEQPDPIYNAKGLFTRYLDKIDETLENGSVAVLPELWQATDRPEELA
jgi:hypothetical protein